ncbi:MAG: glycine--tRNA ligase subunit beta [Alphaproteobacteria bacterium]|nr:glycine--tRNA ligase subunit beta [Alphaproteobacteria bacterium]
MSSGELLLELLSEEIPARLQRRAIADLTALIRDKLAAAEIPAANVTGFVTPRRLTVIAEGIPAAQPDHADERRGPRVGAPAQAVEGFLRSTGLQSLEQCETRDTGRGEFYFAVVRHAGRPAAEVLPDLLRAAIHELPWAKSMRFPAAAMRWVRPLISAICLYDGAVLPLVLDRVPVGRTTKGHRFLSKGDIAVESAEDYRTRLEAAHVILDQDRRRAMIEHGLQRLASAEGLRVREDPALLDEVSGLVEYPVVLMGSIDTETMVLPGEVLATAMRTHQKYFTCLHEDGSAAPHFLFVANNVAADGGQTIVAGNERVLRARLADARFFWEQDRKVRLADRVAALADRVYHARLGTVHDKVERVEKIAMFLAAHVERRIGPRADPPRIAARAQRAARLAKADLSTGMVAEFPELQGIMGRYYALHDGEEQQIADAIAEHYKPLGPNDSMPRLPVAVAVALADKLDTLTAFFTIGEFPTGSRDPFALRRAALGTIRLILENRMRLSLGHAFAYAAVQLGPEIKGHLLDAIEVKDKLLEFVADRLKVHLRERGVRHDLIAAVFALAEDDLVRLLSRVDTLAKFLADEDGANLLTAYRRASNIVSIEERRDQRSYTDAVDPDALVLPQEQALYERLNAMSGRLKSYLEQEHYEHAMGRLASLRAPIDEFFEKVTVNVDESRLRENRLRLLSRIRAVMNQVADFSKIEG